VSRAGSQLDYVCNRLVNPNERSAIMAEAHRAPRRGSYVTRLEAVRILHAELRGDSPGWGRLDILALERLFTLREGVA
jgi:hypothetical protein